MNKSIGYIRRKAYNLFHPLLGEILMLHRVVDVSSKLKLNKNLEISKNFLEQTVLSYIDKGYYLASLDEVYDILKGYKKLNQPFVCFTFDDGYKDNYLHAYPVFKKYSCPFTIYVTTDFIEKEAIIWWYVLEDILLQNEMLKLTNGLEYDVDDLYKKNAAFEDIHEKLSEIEPHLLKSTFDDWFSNCSYSFSSKVEELALTKEELISLANDDICIIGSHTKTHPRLANMNSEKQKIELSESKAILEKWLGKSVDHLAYPFGSHNAESIRLAETLRYKTAVIAWGGNTRKGDDLFTLKRINVLER